MRRFDVLSLGGMPSAVWRCKPSPMVSQVRHSAGVEMLAPIAKLGQSKDLTADIKAGRERNNKEIVASFDNMHSQDLVKYRKTDRPWEVIPRFSKRRVVDMCNLLQSEHRMEIEQTIDLMQTICKVDLYVVIVPTVGYVTPKLFANSLMFEWCVGEHIRGQGGMVLLICQHEATVHLSPSYALEEYFGARFLTPAVREIFAPLVKSGDPSFAVVQLVYAIARHAQEVRHMWDNPNALISFETRNTMRLAAHTVAFGIREQKLLVFGCVLLVALTLWLISRIMDVICPKCHRFMHRVLQPELLQTIMPRGQYLEMKNECAHYRVWKCPHCREGQNIRFVSRDLHYATKCQKCFDCGYYTATQTKTIEALPTKHVDGLKKVLIECENCRIGREIMLPLFHPVDTKPEEQWYGFLLERGASSTLSKIDLKR